MSKLIAKIVKVESVATHTNSDNLDIAKILGFQCVAKRGEFRPGDLAVYFPPDTMFYPEISDSLGITTYLSEKLTVNPEGQTVRAGKTKVVKLRGEPSFGVLVPIHSQIEKLGELCTEGSIVNDVYRVWKYEPPVDARSAAQANQASDIYEWFTKYTDIENLRHYPDIFEPGEMVVATEKIHGSNVRIGYYRDSSSEKSENYVAGSRRHRRKIPVRPKTDVISEGQFFAIDQENLLAPDYPDNWKELQLDFSSIKSNQFWFPYTVPGVVELIHHIRDQYSVNNGKVTCVIYGEVYGNGIQKKFDYSSEREYGFRVFDIKVNEKYLDYAVMVELCNSFGVPLAPELFSGPYDYKKLEQLTNGPTIIGGRHIREGLVIRPHTESWNSKIGRKILKFVGWEYLTQKDSGKVTDFTED